MAQTYLMPRSLVGSAYRYHNSCGASPSVLNEKEKWMTAYSTPIRNRKSDAQKAFGCALPSSLPAAAAHKPRAVLTSLARLKLMPIGLFI